MVFWKFAKANYQLRSKLVSILVLLDGILEVWLKIVLAESQPGFNPCFVGWYSGSLPKPTINLEAN
jgi:hypothetical protein